MVSRQETARPLLTPGEVMQLPPDDELVLVSGCPPIRAKKARYYEDPRFRERVLPPATSSRVESRVRPTDDDWSKLPLPGTPRNTQKPKVQEQQGGSIDDSANGGIRREPELPVHEDVAPDPTPAKTEFEFTDEDADDDVQRAGELRRATASVVRQASMDPDDGLEL
jgi:type IV secretion system protein VirD4